MKIRLHVKFNPLLSNELNESMNCTSDWKQEEIQIFHFDRFRFDLNCSFFTMNGIMSSSPWKIWKIWIYENKSRCNTILALYSSFGVFFVRSLLFESFFTDLLCLFETNEFTIFGFIYWIESTSSEQIPWFEMKNFKIEINSRNDCLWTLLTTKSLKLRPTTMPDFFFASKHWNHFLVGAHYIVM